MFNDWLRKLRGARHIELYVALVLAAIMGLMLLSGGSENSAPEKTPLESRMERILSRIEGVGRVSVMVAQNEDGEATGVVIVADRIDDVPTYLRLQRAVLSLVETAPDRVEIIGRRGCFGGGL